MKSLADMSIDELSQLPEWKDYDEVIADTTEKAAEYGVRLGDTVRITTAKKMEVPPLSGNDPVFWTDANGTWMPIRANGRWYKAPFVGLS